MRAWQRIIATAIGMVPLALAPAEGGAQAKTFQVYTHPKATPAPTNPVEVKDMAPVPGTASSDLEAIVNRTSQAAVPNAKSAKTPAAPAAAEAPAATTEVPEPVPPVQIIPPPSELLTDTASPATHTAGLPQRLLAHAVYWKPLIEAACMLAVLLFSAVLTLTSRRQYALLRQAAGAAETAAHAARQSAESAQLAAIMQPATERPYVFLEQNLQGSVSSEAQGEPAQFTIKFAFRNHGRTPAIITDLQASGSYWIAGYPDTLFAASHNASQGMVVSPGERSAPFTLVFTVSIQDLQEAYSGKGQLLFWGKLLYRDMFGELRETAFCRCYNFEEKAFRMAPAENLNYHT